MATGDELRRNLEKARKESARIWQQDTPPGITASFDQVATWMREAGFAIGSVEQWNLAALVVMLVEEFDADVVKVMLAAAARELQLKEGV